jgi:ribosomal protein S18 acetylase RimI-like enzyme
MLCEGGRAKMMDLEVRRFEQRDEASVAELWNECGLVVPWNDPFRDIERKIAVQPEMFLVGCREDRVVATVMVGYDGHRGWINYLAVRPQLQGTGIGRRMMDEAEDLLRAAGCPKINLQVRATNRDVIEFYEKVGFVQEDIVNLGKRLQRDD